MIESKLKEKDSVIGNEIKILSSNETGEKTIVVAIPRKMKDGKFQKRVEVCFYPDKSQVKEIVKALLS
jgi:hypothetical protein